MLHTFGGSIKTFADCKLINSAHKTLFLPSNYAKHSCFFYVIRMAISPFGFLIDFFMFRIFLLIHKNWIRLNILISFFLNLWLVVFWGATRKGGPLEEIFRF